MLWGAGCAAKRPLNCAAACLASRLPPSPRQRHPARLPAAAALPAPGCCHPARLPAAAPWPKLLPPGCYPAPASATPPQPPGCCYPALAAATWLLLATLPTRLLLPCPSCYLAAAATLPQLAATRLLLCCHQAALLPPGSSAATRLLCCQPATWMLPPCPSFCHPAAATVLLLLPPGCALLPPCPCGCCKCRQPYHPCPTCCTATPATLPCCHPAVAAHHAPPCCHCACCPASLHAHVQSNTVTTLSRTNTQAFFPSKDTPPLTTMPSDQQPSRALSQHNNCRTYDMLMNQPTHHPAAGPNLLSYTISQDSKRETYSRYF
jgi:hypothetical protein